MRKRICTLLATALLFIPCSTAFALDEPEPQTRPSIESILREYQIQAMTSQDNGIAPCALPGESPETDLTQQAVDALTDAGYAAYNVNSSTYSSVEDVLNSDMSKYGLADGDSYIVVVSGSDTSSPAPASLGPVPDYEIGDDNIGGDPNVFYHTYNGTRYKMRYVTVTAADVPADEQDHYRQSDAQSIGSAVDAFGDNIWSCCVSFMSNISSAVSHLYLIRDAFNAVVNNPEANLTGPDDMMLFGNATWTRVYTEVWEEDTETWVASYQSSYATLITHCVGYQYDPVTNTTALVTTAQDTEIEYSPLYYNPPARKNNAAWNYECGDMGYDVTGHLICGLSINGVFEELFELKDEFWYWV